jgi:hypothetical protein
MHRSIELSLELTAQELLAPSAFTPSIEVDDIDSIAPVITSTAGEAANADQPPPYGELVEIELTGEQIDALLEGRLAL